MAHHHTDEDWAFLNHLIAEAEADLVGYDALWICPDCGRKLWLDALDGIAHPPSCCGWEMVPTPAMRRRDPLERASVTRPDATASEDRT
jgi:hypothetical protein